MELTVCPLSVVALTVLAACLVGLPISSDAQRIVSFPSSVGYETNRRHQIPEEEFPRREDLLEALDFLEEYERVKANDWYKEENTGGRDVHNLGNNEIYPLDLDGAGDNFMAKSSSLHEYPGQDNTLDIPPWLNEYFLRQAVKQPEEYTGTREEEGTFPGGNNDEEIQQMVLDTEAYEEIVQEGDEALADAVEKEKEATAVDNILEDIWAQDVLQQDAEKQLRWLVVEEEKNMRRKDEEGEEDDDEDPFQFEFYSDDVAESSGPSFIESSNEEQESDYVSSDAEEEGGYAGESSSDAEKEELKEEEMEIIKNLQEEVDEMEKEAKVGRILKALADTLTKEAIQEENEEEQEDGEDVEAEDEEQDYGSSSVFDAGMIADGSDEEKQKQHVVEDEVNQELVEFLEEEIDRAIGDLAEDILRALEEDEQREEQSAGDQERYDVFNILRNHKGDTDEKNLDMTATEVESENDVCSTLEYFVDNCNIVNNYAGLGADGYKDLFTGACNRHQLCYACGEYYDVGSKLCDEIFKAEMLAGCDIRDVECKQRAKYFWLVARNNRVPDLEPPPLCADPCILTSLIQL